METNNIILLVISMILAAYEVITRFIPTVKDYTILGVIIKLLLVISNALNNGVKNINPFKK